MGQWGSLLCAEHNIWFFNRIVLAWQIARFLQRPSTALELIWSVVKSVVGLLWYDKAFIVKIWWQHIETFEIYRLGFEWFTLNQGCFNVLINTEEIKYHSFTWSILPNIFTWKKICEDNVYRMIKFLWKQLTWKPIYHTIIYQTTIKIVVGA